MDVSLNKGLATIELKPGNSATLKQLQDAITKNGFTTKQSEVTVLGKLVSEGGRSHLQVMGTNETYDLVPEKTVADNLSVLAGKTVVVEGVVPETPKGKSPDGIRYSSVREDSNP